MVNSICWALSALMVMNWKQMSTLPLTRFGTRSSEDCSTNLTFSGSPKRELATIFAMETSKPQRLPLSS